MTSSLANGTCASCAAPSASLDYCDGCGAALTLPAAQDVRGPEVHTTSCPGCTAVGAPGDSFCEVCGLDFESGDVPSEPEGSTGWSVVIAADRNFFDSNSVEALDGLRFPEDLQPREVALRGDEMVVGRGRTNGSSPDIDLEGDPGVSRQHAILRRQPDGSWDLIDRGSANGIWVNGSDAPAEPGSPICLQAGDCFRLGAFHVLRISRGGR